MIFEVPHHQVLDGLEFSVNAGVPRLGHGRPIASRYLKLYGSPESYKESLRRNDGSKGFGKRFRSDRYQSSVAAAVSQKSKISWG